MAQPYKIKLTISLILMNNLRQANIVMMSIVGVVGMVMMHTVDMANMVEISILTTGKRMENIRAMITMKEKIGAGMMMTIMTTMTTETRVSMKRVMIKIAMIKAGRTQ